MSLKVRWTRRADKKFDRIIGYLSNEWGEKSTHKFAKRVFEVLDILAEFPEMGSLENREKFIRGFTIVRQVNVFYKVDEDILIFTTAEILIRNVFDLHKQVSQISFRNC